MIIHTTWTIKACTAALETISLGALCALFMLSVSLSIEHYVLAKVFVTLFDSISDIEENVSETEHVDKDADYRASSSD